jgi:hypothetical protein
MKWQQGSSESKKDFYAAFFTIDISHLFKYSIEYWNRRGEGASPRAPTREE